MSDSSSDLADYRATVRSFIDAEITPFYGEWTRSGHLPRELFKKAAATGLYGLEIPESYGGPGVTDYRYRQVAVEELARARATSVSVSFTCMDDLVTYYLNDLGTEPQKRQWLSAVAAGECIGALAMTEPDAGSDLRGMKTSALPSPSGWTLNGSKAFITHGPIADVIIVAANTPQSGKSRGPISLFIVPGDVAGLTRTPPYDKVGLRAQATGGLFFDDVQLGPESLLGAEGAGLSYLMSHLPRERLGTTLTAVAESRAVFEIAARYSFERHAFGRPIGDFQATRFTLAELETELELAELLLERQIAALNAGTLTAIDAAKGKWWTTELQMRIVDKAVQLHGGSGFMADTPVGQAYLDARIQPIYAGTTEIMKDLIGRDIARRYQPADSATA